MPIIHRPRLAVAALLIAALFVHGCAHHYRPTGDTPTLVDRAVGQPGESTPQWPRAPSDQDVLNFTNEIKTLMRKHMGFNRMMRMVSGTFQVLTAATAAALGATTGNLTAITALAGASAVTPHLQEIFDARAVAGTYRQGVELIERAEGQYFERRAKRMARDTARRRDTRDAERPVPRDAEGLVPGTTFTRDGAKLYIQVLASIRVVERTLVAQLPTIDDLRRAVGELDETFDHIDDHVHELAVSPKTLTLRVNDKAAVLVLAKDNVVTLVSSDRPDVVTAAVAEGAHSVSLTAVGAGVAHVTVLSDKNLRAQVTVTVTARAVESPVVIMAPASVTSGEAFSVVVAGTTPAAKLIAKNALTTMVHLRQTGAGGAPFFEEFSHADDWECGVMKQASVTCQPKKDIASSALAPHLRLKVNVPASYGGHPLTIVTEVATEGRQTLDEAVQVVPRHPLTLTMAQAGATLTAAAAAPYTVTLVNAGPSEASGLSLALTIAGPATLDAPTDRGGWQCQAAQAAALTCTRDRLAVETTKLIVPIKATGAGTVTIKTEVKAASGPGASSTVTVPAAP